MNRHERISLDRYLTTPPDDFDVIDDTEANEYWSEQDEQRMAEMVDVYATYGDLWDYDGGDDDYEPDGPTLGNSTW